MADKNIFSNLTDQELVVKIIENSDYLGVVYKRCKSNCLNFMRRMSNGSISEYELEDVIQDTFIILQEKIIIKDFLLTASFQTYLNSVCRFQLLNKYKSNLKTVVFDDYGKGDVDDDENENYQYDSNITDELEPIKNEKESQFEAIEKSLEKMKNAGGRCYDLLTQFWYKKRSMTELTAIFEYTNPANTKSQKAKCQERLRVMSFNELNSN
ncbi:RNA polymerase sigma factor [Flavobacterium sp. W22_SRS_FP1]|uniref:RNA polymerase sigma factor n=1 Tax=Flavobacterium sp. W22_SRS_FP1 TaxID=3240276 RepID=UPI003F933B59